MGSYVLVGALFLFLSMSLLVSGMVLGVKGEVLLMDYYLVEFMGVDLSYESVFDWVSCLYLGVVLYISGSVMIYSEDYMRGQGLRFLWLMVGFVLSMVLMVLSGGVVSVSLGWDGLGLISYCLVVYYQSASSYKAGSITVMTNRVGDVILLLSIGWMLVFGGWGYIFLEGEASVGVSISVAACTKSAQIPFSAWLPEAMAAPTPVSSLVHSSTLVTAGVFLLIRFNFLFLGESCSYLLSWVSLSTSVGAGVGALMEMDMKKVVASSTLSQLGLSMFMLAIGMWVVSYFHMMMHAMFKALMFLCIGGVIYGEGGGQDFRWGGGKLEGGWVVSQGLLISIFCLSGFPFLCGFFSKDLSLESYLSGEKGILEVSAFLLGLSMSVLYGFRSFYGSSMGGGVMGGSLGGYGEGKWMSVSIFLMTVVSLVAGVLYFWLVEECDSLVMLWGGLKSLSGFIIVVGLFLIMLKGGGLWPTFKWFYCEKVWLLGGGLEFLKDKLVDYDQEWVESYGGGGVSSSLGKIWGVYELIYMGSLVSFIFLSLGIIVFYVL